MGFTSDPSCARGTFLLPLPPHGAVFQVLGTKLGEVLSVLLATLPFPQMSNVFKVLHLK